MNIYTALFFLVEDKMKKKDASNLIGKEFLLYLLPVFAAMVPVVIATGYVDSPVLGAIFGGWNSVVMIPAAFCSINFFLRTQNNTAPSGNVNSAYFSDRLIGMTGDKSMLTRT